jgi:hypothetical protein
MKSNLTKILLLLYFIVAQKLFATTLLVPQQFSTIQKAVDNAMDGDTILISTGFYRENVVVNKVLTIKGTSTNYNVIIEDATTTPYVGSYIFLITVPGTGEISGLTLQGNNNSNVYCTGIKLTEDGWLIRDCIFQNLGGIYTYEASSTIERNLFKKLKGQAISAGENTKVIGNVIYGDKEDGVIAEGKVHIINNFFEDCLSAIRGGGENDSIFIRNNTITSIGNIYSSNQRGITIYSDSSPIRIENNIIALNNGMGISSGYNNLNLPDAYIANNNDVFMNSIDYLNIENRTGISGNISLNPIFCDNDSLFFLASDSPCIDSGSDEFSDIDGSPADMGMYGGPDAVKIKYGPSSFNLIEPEDEVVFHINSDPFTQGDSVLIIFKWSPSFDRDQTTPPKYRVIIGKSLITDICRNRDCTTYLVDDVVDTLFIDSTTLSVNVSKYRRNTYYYVVEAYDNDGIFKRTNTVRSFTLLDENIFPDDYFILQNFPNPFNSSTKIRYGLPYSGIISIKLYDILGREVLTIDEGFKEIGYYEAIFTSSMVSSGVYFYKFDLISANIPKGVKSNFNFPVIKKLVIIK